MEPFVPSRASESVFGSQVAKRFVHDATGFMGVLATNDPTEWPLHTMNEVRRALSIAGGLDGFETRISPLHPLEPLQVITLVGIAITVGAPVSLKWKQRAWEAASREAVLVPIPTRAQELEHFQALVMGYDGVPVQLPRRRQSPYDD
jgi:hypothetical protein